VKPVKKDGTVYYDLTAKKDFVVSNIKPLKLFHVLTVQYPSGRTIYGLPTDGVDELVVRALLVTAKGDICYYIGPENGAEAAKEKARQTLMN
jgi:hypothetical protein